jgi:branched-chain amino acid transport system ATP-binding protein
MSALKIQNLTKAYGKLVVSRDINLEVLDGERHIVIGPNGAGKTTLLNQIGGQTTSDSGRIVLGNRDVTRLSADARARAGLSRTFQKNTLFPSLSVFENVRLGVQRAHGITYNFFKGAAGLSAVNSATDLILQRMELAPIAQAVVANLSYGELRQIEVAMALSSAPKMLLLDEPTSGLSPTETRKMIAVLKTIPRETSILMIEHDMDVVFSIADRITVLYYGEILASGSAEEIKSSARVQEVYLGALH